MKIRIVIIAVLLALVGCSRPGDGASSAIAEDQAGSVSHAKPEQRDLSEPGAQPTWKKKPSELDRLLREGAQEKGQGLGRLDRKRGE
jgi:hypothetical protein